MKMEFVTMDLHKFTFAVIALLLFLSPHTLCQAPEEGKFYMLFNQTSKYHLF